TAYTNSPGPGDEVVVRVDLAPGRSPVLTLSHHPRVSLEPAISQRVYDRLIQVKAPPVTAPVAFQLLFILLLGTDDANLARIDGLEKAGKIEEARAAAEELVRGTPGSARAAYRLATLCQAYPRHVRRAA